MRGFDMFKDIVTVFNYFNGKWLPTVISGAELQYKSGINEKNSGVLSSDNALLFVHIIGDFIGDKKYLTPKAFRKSYDTGNCITFAEGDFFVVGEFSQSVNDEDYVDGYFSYMCEQCDYCYKITSVKRYKGIPHFEIRGV